MIYKIHKYIYLLDIENRRMLWNNHEKNEVLQNDIGMITVIQLRDKTYFKNNY